MNNMDIWGKVEKTDPGHAKKFSTGKLSGISPNATYNFKRATEVFGPAGKGWWVEVVDDRLESINTGGDYEHTTHVMSVDLHWKLDEHEGVVRGYGQTPVCYPGRNGPVVDYDYMKKSYTDAVTNALKQLGFSADIWMGLYDDNKYIAELKKHFAQMEAEPQPSGSKIVDNDTGEILLLEQMPAAKVLEKALWAGSLIKEATSDTQRRTLWKANQELFKRAAREIGLELRAAEDIPTLDSSWSRYGPLVELFPATWRDKLMDAYRVRGAELELQETA